MKNRKRKDNGEIGEKDVCELVKCPNCNKKLIQLPRNYPLFDVQCESCYFRAQIKTSSKKPVDTIPGSSYNIMLIARKIGLILPPLIVNYKWKDEKKKQRHEIRFYPFVSIRNMYPSIRRIKQKKRSQGNTRCLIILKCLNFHI